MHALPLFLLASCARSPEEATRPPDPSSPAPSSTETTPTGDTGPTTSSPPTTTGSAGPPTGTVRVVVDAPAYADVTTFRAEVRVDGVLVHEGEHTYPQWIVEDAPTGGVEVRVTDGAWESFGYDSGSYAGLSGCAGSECAGVQWGILVDGAELVVTVPFDCEWEGCD